MPSESKASGSSTRGFSLRNPRDAAGIFNKRTFKENTVARQIKSLRLFFVIAAAAAGLISCGKDPVRTGADDSGQNGIRKDQYPWAAFSVVKGLERGASMTLSVNRRDFDVTEVNVVFEAVYEYKYQRLIICRTPDDFPIGSGDSGSPVSLADGRIAGLLCYGYNGNSHQFAARAIEDVMSVTDSDGEDAPAKNESSLLRPILPVMFSSGVDPAYIRRMQAKDRSGFFERLSAAESISKSGRMEKRSSGGAVPVIPGVSIAVLEISGDLVDMGAIGTLGIIESDRMYAFGHSYSQYPDPLAAPALLAKTATFIESDLNGFKYAVPTQDTIGAFTSQSGYGILIREGMRPRTFPADVSVQFNDSLPAVYSHRIANAQSVGYEKFLGSFVAGYAVYVHLPSFVDSDSLFARGRVRIVSESGVLDTTLQLDGTSLIDEDISEFIDRKMVIEDPGTHITAFQAEIRIFERRDEAH
jgi:hypothetical protein